MLPEIKSQKLNATKTEMPQKMKGLQNWNGAKPEVSQKKTRNITKTEMLPNYNVTQT